MAIPGQTNFSELHASVQLYLAWVHWIAPMFEDPNPSSLRAVNQKGCASLETRNLNGIDKRIMK